MSINSLCDIFVLKGDTQFQYVLNNSLGYVCSFKNCAGMRGWGSKHMMEMSNSTEIKEMDRAKEPCVADASEARTAAAAPSDYRLVCVVALLVRTAIKWLSF